MSLSIVPWQRLLPVEILQLHMLKFCFHSLPCRTQPLFLEGNVMIIEVYPIYRAGTPRSVSEEKDRIYDEAIFE
jgi:hypothetical protein